jgi:hypothetical protein
MPFVSALRYGVRLFQISCRSLHMVNKFDEGMVMDVNPCNLMQMWELNVKYSNVCKASASHVRHDA